MRRDDLDAPTTHVHVRSDVPQLTLGVANGPSVTRSVSVRVEWSGLAGDDVLASGLVADGLRDHLDDALVER